MNNIELREIIAGLLKRVDRVEKVNIDYHFDGDNTAELTVTDQIGNRFVVTIYQLSGEGR